jgi:hypothetical protein
MGTHGCIVASSPVPAISVGALRELLAQDLLAALGEIRCAIEKSDEGKVPYQLVGQRRFRLWAHRHEPRITAAWEASFSKRSGRRPLRPGTP